MEWGRVLNYNLHPTHIIGMQIQNSLQILSLVIVKYICIIGLSTTRLGLSLA